MRKFIDGYNTDCENKLKNALFMMGETGGNDINAAIIDKKSDEEIKTLFPEIVETIMNATRVIFNNTTLQQIYIYTCIY